MSGNSRDAQDPNRDYCEAGQNFLYFSELDDIKSLGQSDLWGPDQSFTWPSYESTDLMAVLPSSPMTWSGEQSSDASHHQDNGSTNSREDTSNSAAKLT